MKTKKKIPGWKKALRIFLFSVLGLMLILILIPILFRPQLVAFAKKQLNNQLNATVEFKDIRLSLIRHFPRLDLKLSDLSIVGKDRFEGDTLIFSPATHIVTNVKTLFKSNVKIYRIELIDPVINALVDSSGKQNFDIAKSGTGADGASESEFSMELQHYSIRNGTVTYNDDLSKIYTRMKHFDHSGSGNFTEVRYRVRSETKADSVNFKYGTITYLTGASIDLPLDLDIDTKSGKYEFTGKEFFINSVPLSSEGTVTDIGDSAQNVNITVKANQSDFKTLLTLIPGVYKQDISSLETKGKAIIDGKVTGMITSTRNPDFDFKIDVTDGYIKNPDFNEPIQNINVNAAIVNTGGTNDATTISLKNGSAYIGNEPIRFTLDISRPVSLMLLDLAVKGKVQLEKLKQILKLDNMDMRGLLNADLKANGPLGAFENARANSITASGYLVADNFYYKDQETLPLQATSVDMRFNNTNAAINFVNANYNNTSFSGKGNIFNFFNFLFVNESLRGKISVSSPQVNIADWNSGQSTASSSSAVTKPFVVPSGILLELDAQTDKLISDEVVINDLDGKVLISDKKMLFENISGKAFDGNININGSYSSENNPQQPDITLHYKLTNLDVQKTFKAFVTAKSLMPIGNYLSGILSSQLSAIGRLGDNFHPILNSLFGNGDLLLINGFLEKFPPLEMLADRLGVDKLKNLSVKEIRNHFSFENGLVNVLPFKFTLFNNYEFEVAGRHGFDNSLDYGIKLTMPKGELGAKGNQLLENLFSSAGQSMGLNLKADDKVSFFIKMTGLLNSPKLDIQLHKTLTNEFEELKKQAEAQVMGKIDSTKEKLKDTLSNIKKDILHGLKDKIFAKEDSISNQQPQKDTPNKKNPIKSVFDILNRKTKKDTLN